MKTLTSPTAVVSSAPSPAPSSTYLLVHGGWHGAWCWQKVVPILEAKGHRVLAPDLPGHGADQTPPGSVTLDDYVQRVVSVANAQAGPVILVGHSMAGVVIAQAAEVLGKDKVAQLVYLDAFMPQDGESVLSLAGKIGAAQHKPATSDPAGPTMQESIIFSEDQQTCWLKPENVTGLFYHDCSPDDVAFAKARLDWQPTAGLTTPVRVTEARYGAVPKVFILCTDARDMDKSSLMQNVPGLKIHELPSSHSPFFSMPERLAALLLEL